MRVLRLMVSAVLAIAIAIAMPAQAQDADRIDKRVGKLESEMRAVQRKVFPGSDSRFFEPEITVPEPVIAPVGTPATAPIADLTDRIGELERQLRTLTGQVETAEFKLRQLEDAQAKQRADVEFRLNALETSGVKPAAVAAPDAVPETPLPNADAKPGAKPAATTPAKPAAKPTTADAAWKLAYANVSGKNWPETEAAMAAFIADWPKSTRLPQAQYWLGRSHAERTQHAEAARSFLKVYETAPRSPQAPDSLIGLADALTGLKKPKDACRVLGELDSVYGAKLTADQKTDAAALKKRAKCAA